MNRAFFFFLVFFLIGPGLRAQVELVPDRFAFDPDLNYDPSIPSPEQFLGYRLGEAYTLYAHVVQYFEKLAESSGGVILNRYGETYEGRPLINLVISSQANIRRIEEIRRAHLKLTDPGSIGAGEAEELIKDQPVFISYSYNIHGNETSSTEAAMQVAYRLAAATDADTRRILDQSVIILYVCINPDGRDRYVYWYKSMRRHRTASEPRDLEHYEPWPGGRTNHYWFDLNRDWVWGVHPESRGHVQEYQRWMPQVHVDYHEQGYNSNYFTVPGTTPRNLLLPKMYEAWADTFGRANIAAFDRHQINYFTRDAFDFFYPGYGSSYPSVMGAIGMLTEQGGIGGGRAVETDDGYVLTLRQRIFDHYLTSIATIKKSVEHREQLLRYSFEAWKPQTSQAATKAYLLPDNATGYLYDVIGMLLRHGVKVERTTADLTVAEAMDFRTGKPVRKVFPKGTFLISAEQPRHLFLHSVMERNLAIEDSVMYDMATWSAPIAYNLESYSVRQPVKVTAQIVEKIPDWPSGLNYPGAQYAYVIEWKQRNAPQALAKLWEKGYRVRAAREPFTDGVKKFGQGSLIILKGRNLEKAAQIDADMADIAQSAKVVIDGFNTGRMLDGMDLASTDNRPVKKPRVGLMVDEPFDAYTGGQLYFLFDWETGLPVERIRTSVFQQTALPKFGGRFGNVNLLDYDVLILPGGGANLERLFGKEQLDEFRAWITNGGVLIASESAVPFFTAGKSKFTKVKLLEVKKDSSQTANFLHFEAREDYYGKKRIPGSALNAHIDTSHPLAFGMDRQVYSLKGNTDALKADPDLQTVGYYYREPEELLAAGYASAENLQHLAGNTFAGVLPIGRGKVVFFVDNTQYRMFWRGPSRMMQNAVMLLPGF